MRTTFTALLLAAAASTMFGASPIPENFESLTNLEEAGWTTTSTVPERFGWDVVEYSAETTQFPNNLPIPEQGGLKCLKGLTGGFNPSEAPDIRLITPTFTIEEGNTNLRFLYCNNMVTNGAGNVAESDRAIFTVSISPMGEDEPNEVLLEETPVNKNLWRVVNLDLSKYAGKEVRLQFRCSMANPVRPYTYNFLYIDNLEFTSSGCPDFQAISLSGFTAGTIRETYPTATFTNHSTPAGDIRLTLSAEGAESVTENYPQQVGNGETVEYTFNTPLILPSGFNGAVTLEIEHPDDTFTLNNTTSASASIATINDLPFILAEGELAQMQMITTAKGTLTVPDGWQFITGSHNAWVSTNYRKEAFLYTTEAYHLTGAPLRVAYTGNLVGETANFNVYLTKRTDDFGEPAGVMPLTNGAVDNVMLVPVAEEGDYLIAFKITDYSELRNQFKLSTLHIEEAAGNPDICAMSVLPTGSIVADTDADVTLRISNQGAEDATGVEVSYTAGEQTVTETIPTIATGETVEWTFSTPLNLSEGDYTLRATVSQALDTNTENDTIESSLTAYTPRELPYRDSFEDDDEAALWTYPNESGWFISDYYNFDGTHMMCLGGKTGATHNDWLLSPAIEIPQNFNGRLSFYYGSGGNQGTSVLDAYITPASTPERILESEPLVSRPTSGVDVDYASVAVNDLPAGTYYIAFHAKDGSESLLLDDVRLDSSDEISIDSITLSTPVAAGYDHKPAEITVHGHNYSLHPISGLKVAYQASISSFGNVTTISPVTAVYHEEIPAGADYEFTFPQQLEFNETGIYIIAAAIDSDVDSDKKNNSFQVMGPEVLPTRTLPALWDNERDDYLHGYIYNSESKWDIRALRQYDGQAALYHMGENGNTIEGDWAFLNRVYIPAGTYQGSLFWGTLTDLDGDKYAHSFDLTLSDAPAADANHQVILSNTAPTAPDKKSRKELAEFTVEKDGYYFVGIHLKDCTSQGSIAIDNIKIEAPEAAYDLTAPGTYYQSDFAEAMEEWYHYHPSKMYSQQWNEVTDPSGSLHALQAIEFKANDVQYTASYIQAPSMLLAGDTEYKVTVQSQIDAAPYDEHVDWNDLTGNEEFVVHVSDVDLPTSFKELGRIRAKEYTKAFSFRPETTGIHYISIGTAGAQCAAFTLVGLNVANMNGAGVDAINAEGADGEGRWYTIDGIETAAPTPGSHGIFIHVVGGKASKVIF